MKSKKQSILNEQLPDLNQIKLKNESTLASTLNMFKLFMKLPTESAIAECTDALCTLEFFRKNCPEGNKLSDFVQHSAQYFKYEQFKKGQIVMNYGESGSKMYIVLQGDAAVYVPRSQEEVNKDLEWVQTQKDTNDYFHLWRHKRSTVQIQFDKLLMQNIDYRDQYFEGQVAHYMMVTQFYAGQHFGELALSQDKPRTASILALSDELHLISMNRNDYKLVCDKSIQELNSKIDYFMKQFPGNGKFTVSKFIQHFKQIQFSTSTILWKEGDEPKFYFLIIKGRVELYRYVYEDVLHGKPIPNQHDQIIKHNKKKKLILCQLSDNTFVGQEELIDGSTSRQYCCQVGDITQAYYMEAEEFNNIKKAYPEIVRCLKDKHSILTKYMTNRQQSIVDNCIHNDIKMKQIKQGGNKMQEQKSLKEMLKEAEDDRPDKDYVRSYKPKVLSENEITGQNCIINQVKKQSDPPGEFVLMDPHVIEKIKIRVNRLFKTTTEDKPERQRTIQVQDSRILITRIKSGLQKRSKLFKAYSDVSMMIKSQGADTAPHANTNFTGFLFPTTPSNIVLSRNANPSRQDANRLRNKVQSKHSPKIPEIQELDMQIATRRMQTASGTRRRLQISPRINSLM